LVRFSPKSFAQPDLLKTIQPSNLIRLLEPCRGFLEARGLILPQNDTADIDYLQLAGILAQPDEWMDSNVVEGLHVIGNLGTDSNFDELLDIARRNFIDVDLESTAADLAARIWSEFPQALALKEREVGTHRRRRFESFRARDLREVVAPRDLPFDFIALEADLEAWYMAKNRGIGCRVLRIDQPDEVRFLVQHGQLCRREPSRKGAQSTCTFFRPERTDLVVYDPVTNELRISTGSIGELRLYREKIGKHVFGDPEKFAYAEKYTLTPLQTDGAKSLQCRDIGGLEWARLTEVEFDSGASLSLVKRLKASDLFPAMELDGTSIPPHAIQLHARFVLKLAGETTPRPVFIQPPNIAEYGRGEEAPLIERWLIARRFVLVGREADDENPGKLLAVA
jgi:hypothetical protein